MKQAREMIKEEASMNFFNTRKNECKKTSNIVLRVTNSIFKLNMNFIQIIYCEVKLSTLERGVPLGYGLCINFIFSSMSCASIIIQRQVMHVYTKSQRLKNNQINNVKPTLNIYQKVTQIDVFV